MKKPDPVVETQELRIVDVEGRVRVRLGMIDDKSVGLHLLRSDGSAAIKIELSEEGFVGDFVEFPRIDLLDTAGKLRLSLSIGEADGMEMSGLSVNGSDGEARVTLVVPPDDYGEISVKDYDGHTTFIQ